MRAAAVDLGTNTALLCVADVSDDGLRVIHDEETIVRLGEGVDATGSITPAAHQRLRDAMEHYAQTARDLGVEAIVGVATSASRDAVNAREVLDDIKRHTGIDLQIISGEEEARLTFLGGISDVPSAGNSVVTIDIGGGSTELTAGQWQDNSWKLDVRSTPTGALRIRDRFFCEMPPTAADIETARRFVAQSVSDFRPPADAELVGTSGSTTVFRHLLERHDPDSLVTRDAAVIVSLTDVNRWSQRLLTAPYDQVLALSPGVMRGRADIYSANMLVLETVMEVLDYDYVVISGGGLRHGVLLEAVKSV